MITRSNDTATGLLGVGLDLLDQAPAQHALLAAQNGLVDGGSSSDTGLMDLEPDDVTAAAAWAADLSGRVTEEQWDTAVLDAWSPRRTLDHLVDVMVLYSGYVATRATGRLTPIRNGDPGATRDELVSALRSASAILAGLLNALPDDARAFHPSGNADRTGWIGMACTELLVHGFDIAEATQMPVSLTDDRRARQVVERVFPWVPSEGTGWSQLLWATGREGLGARPPEASDWWWQSAPLTDWDGQPRRRTTPPQW